MDNFRLERASVDNRILYYLENTWHRIESDMSTEMQSALSILKEVMSYYYEEPCVIAWDDSNLVGITVYETYDDAGLGTRETNMKELASFSHEPGIGSLLVQEIIKIAREDGSQNVSLSHGPGVKSFYERLGFVEDTRSMPAGEVGTLMMYKLSGNPSSSYVPPEEKYSLVKRTRRGSLVTIEKVGQRALLEVTNLEDMTDISNLLNAAGIKWASTLKENTFIPREKRYGTAWIIEFDFSELERVMGSAPFMSEEPVKHIGEG